MSTETEKLNGAELIAQERLRQVAEEGWTPEHDDGHDVQELAMAAAAYAWPSAWAGGTPRADLWPWGDGWNPGPRLDELVRAGALIAAEIDRLQRAASSSASRGGVTP